MVLRTFLDKANTLKENVDDNFGLTPVLSLNYGLIVSRGIIHFDETGILSRLKDGTFSDKSKVTHRLKMINCASLNSSAINEPVPSEDANKIKKRAVSFDVIFFRINKPWDAGVGFDNYNDIWFTGDKAYSKEASNWFNTQSGNEWDEPGVYDLETLEREVQKYFNGEDSIIINHQHFAAGNEDIDVDITSFINGLYEDKYRNYGIGIAFSPSYEIMSEDMLHTRYVGFFTQHTNTMFEPFVETRYDFRVDDNKFSFYPYRKNNLYLSVDIDGCFENLDTMPTFTLDGKEYDVKQATKGLYYVELKLDEEPDTIKYCTWGNIKLNGEDFGDFEDEFVVLGNNKSVRFNKTSANSDKKDVSANIFGIDDNGSIPSGDVIKLEVLFKEKYNNSKPVIVNNAEYRLYHVSGDREIDIIEWDYVETIGDVNYFMLDTSSLVPGKYHIDLRCRIDNGVRHFKDRLVFNITNFEQLEK